MILSAEPVDGATAQALGIVQWAVPRAGIVADAAALADRLAALPRPALKAAKALIGAHGAGHDAGYVLERELGGALLLTPEAQQRITAFIDKGRSRPAA